MPELIEGLGRLVLSFLWDVVSHRGFWLGTLIYVSLWWGFVEPIVSELKEIKETLRGL